MSWLSCKQLSCERDERYLFKARDFEFELGTAYRVEGPNGAGKTTLLRILVGLNSLYEGDICWRGEALTSANRPEFQQNLLFLGHTAGVKMALTPLENLQVSVALHSQGGFEQSGPAQGGIETQYLYDALARVHLKGYEETPCQYLSAGQRRRVALARLYVEHVPLWVLDEPFTAIDREGVAALEQCLADHVSRQGLVIVTTHHDLKLPTGYERYLLG